MAALLTEGIRRLPRALRSALWLLRTTRLAPLDGGWRVGVVAAVAVVGLGALLTAVSISDWVRTVMGVAAAAFILFPRQ